MMGDTDPPGVSRPMRSSGLPVPTVNVLVRRLFCPPPTKCELNQVNAYHPRKGRPTIGSQSTRGHKEVNIVRVSIEDCNGAIAAFDAGRAAFGRGSEQCRISNLREQRLSRKGKPVEIAFGSNSLPCCRGCLYSHFASPEIRGNATILCGRPVRAL